jgi:hypothetical protein
LETLCIWFLLLVFSSCLFWIYFLSKWINMSELNSHFRCDHKVLKVLILSSVFCPWRHDDKCREMWSHEYIRRGYVACTRWQPRHKDVLWCLHFLLTWLPTSWRHHVTSTLNFWRLHSCGTWTHVKESIGSSEIWVLYVPKCISSHPKRLYLHPYHCENPILMLHSCQLCFGESNIHGNVTHVWQPLMFSILCV